MSEEQILEQRVRQQRAAPKVELSAPPKDEGQRAQAQRQPGRQGGPQRSPAPAAPGKKYKKCHGAQVTVG